MTGFRNEREEARERLRASVDALAERANLQVQMQKEPLKMLGGASAVGALLGIVVGRQFKRTKKVYVDVDSPIKDQKALIKAQQKHKGNNVGGALVATLGTLAFKVLQDRVITPKLEEMASGLMERAGQESGPKPGGQAARPAAPSRAASPGPARSGTAAPISTGGAAGFLKNQGGEADDAARTGVPGGQSTPGTGSSVATPTSTVVAKAQGSPIAPQEKENPNIR